MKRLFKIFVLIFSTTFHSCSWIEGFYIINTTPNPIIIEMQLQSKVVGTFPIFDYASASIYALNKRSKIDFEKSSNLKYDTITKFSHITFKLPPQSAVQIGALHNDKYKSYNQNFINGRFFNLEKIIIKKTDLVIVKTDFDKYFKRDNNEITYNVK